MLPHACNCPHCPGNPTRRPRLDSLGLALPHAPPLAGGEVARVVAEGVAAAAARLDAASSLPASSSSEGAGERRYTVAEIAEAFGVPVAEVEARTAGAALEVVVEDAGTALEHGAEGEPTGGRGTDE